MYKRPASRKVPLEDSEKERREFSIPVGLISTATKDRFDFKTLTEYTCYRRRGFRGGDSWEVCRRRTRGERTENVWADVEKEILGQKNAVTAHADGQKRSNVIMRETTMLIAQKESGINVE